FSWRLAGTLRLLRNTPRLLNETDNLRRWVSRRIRPAKRVWLLCEKPVLECRVSRKEKPQSSPGRTLIIICIKSVIGKPHSRNRTIASDDVISYVFFSLYSPHLTAHSKAGTEIGYHPLSTCKLVQ